MKSPSPHGRQNGFSLFELVAVLVIIGLVLGLSLTAGTIQLRMAEYQGTRDNLEVVRTALDLYQAKHGRYPCPASLILDPSDPAYGVEINTCSPNDTLTGLDGNAVAAIGAVPFRTIGLPEDVALDKWNMRIIYGMDRAHATSSGSNGGRLQVLDAQNRDVVNSPVLGRAIYVLVSTGANNYGGFKKSGTSPAGTWLACIPTAPFPARNTLDAQNCDLADEIFRDMPKNQGAVGNAVFDDEVVWKAQDWGSSSVSIDAPLSAPPPNSISATPPDPKANATSRLAAGSGATCAINHARVPSCWGNNDTQRIGDGTAITPRDARTIKSDKNDWVSISTHNSLSCGVRANGLGYCWGAAAAGALGNGTIGIAEYPTPQLVSADITGSAIPDYTDWVHISAAFTSCGVRANGQIYCWGNGTQGVRGNGLTTDTTLPGLISGGFNDWASVDTSWSHACAVRANGLGYCWGNGNGNGQLGNNTTTGSTVPVQVSNITNWKKINLGILHSCGVTQGGRGYCWGDNTYGQLGDGITGDKLVPQEIVGTHLNWDNIDAGQRFSCGLRNGEAYCWGESAQGQLGIATVPATCASGRCRVPMAVSGGIKDWETLATGFEHACAMRRDGSVWCWGTGATRELGQGAASSSSTPVEASTFRP